MGINIPNFERTASAISGMGLTQGVGLGLSQGVTMPTSISSALDLNLTTPDITLPPIDMAQLMKQHSSIMEQSREQQQTMLAGLHQQASKTTEGRKKEKV